MEVGSKEVGFGLPMQVWQEMMQGHYPDSLPLPLSRDVAERLHRYKSSNGFATRDGALARLLDERAEEGAT